MPYFITNKSADCNGWATVKADGEVMGCHTTKTAAIKQMVAISIAEGIEPGGERALNDELEVGDFVFWNNGGNIQFGLIVAVSHYGPVESQIGASFIATQEKPLATIVIYKLENDQLMETDQFVVKDFAPLTKIGEIQDDSHDEPMNHDEGQIHDESSPDNELMEDERAMPDDLKTGDFVSWNSSGGRARGRIERIAKSGSINVPDTDFSISASEDDPAALIRIWRETADGWNATDVLVGHKFSTLTKITPLNRSLNIRAVNQEAPAFMRAAARRGLEYYADGKGGDGLVDKTIREARLMAQGQVSDDKWIRIAAWIARHTSDLDSPDANPSSDNYPSPGVVAHLLWGSGPSKRQAQRALNYAERVVERIREQENSNRWASVSINLNKDERKPVSKQVERRVQHVEFDVRELDTSKDKMTFRGYAAVFNSPSQPLPFTEYIREGAFTRSLKSRNEIKMFKNHNTDIVLGSTRAGTLRLTEDSTGLLAEADLPPTTDGKDLSILMQRGDVNSMSFGFSVPPKGDSWSSDGQTRELHQIRLHEVSIVTGFPAYEATTASVRSIDYLATRTAVDADALADALTRLEAGEELDSDHAELISEVVTKLRKDKPADSDLSAQMLELKKKQLDLMSKVF